MRPIAGKRYYHLWNKKEPVVGIEPTTGRLRSDYSTSELHRLVLTVVLPRYFTAELHRLIKKTKSTKLPTTLPLGDTVLWFVNLNLLYQPDQASRSLLDAIDYNPDVSPVSSIFLWRDRAV